MAVQHVFSNAVADGTVTSVFEKMKHYLRYCPDTGNFYWLVKRTNNSFANVGDLAGSLDENGYIRLTFDGKKHRAHRLAFVFMGQELPEQVDHVNGVRSDNRWVNLKESNPLQNAKNAKRRSNSKTAITGVTFSKKHNKWKARVNHKGETLYLGLFANLDDAIIARENANIKYGYSYRHGSV